MLSNQIQEFNPISLTIDETPKCMTNPGYGDLSLGEKQRILSPTDRSSYRRW